VSSFAIVRCATLVAIVCAAAACRPAGAAVGGTDSLATPRPADENAFPVTLGSFSTTLVGSAGGRTHNVRLACAALDGAVLEPGDLLSFNRSVGPRTVERGYVEAPVILREARQLQLGGGICQVASTVFTAGLLAGLAVFERHRHSTPVDYIAPGEDATVSWGVKDLKLRNALEQRVRLRVEIVGTTLTARFEGETPLDDAYELVPEVRESEDALAGAPGREIELYRVRRVAGEERDRELVHRDVFPIARTRPAVTP
jgi:vancomycin resistance protein YoaR